MKLNWKIILGDLMLVACIALAFTASAKGRGVLKYFWIFMSLMYFVRQADRHYIHFKETKKLF